MLGGKSTFMGGYIRSKYKERNISTERDGTLKDGIKEHLLSLMLSRQLPHSSHCVPTGIQKMSISEKEAKSEWCKLKELMLRKCVVRSVSELRIGWPT